MTEETTIVHAAGPSTGDSTAFGISVRAWLATLLVITVCLTHYSVVAACLWEAIVTRNFTMVGTYTTVGEPLYSMSVAALGFYFGQLSNKTLKG